MIAAPVQADSAGADPLAGLLVALDLRGIVLRLDPTGERFFASPNSALDGATKALLRDLKPAVMAHLALNQAQRHQRLIDSYEATLWAAGRQWQMARDRAPIAPEALALVDGMLLTMERYAALCGEGGL